MFTNADADVHNKMSFYFFNTILSFSLSLYLFIVLYALVPLLNLNVLIDFFDVICELMIL